MFRNKLLCLILAFLPMGIWAQKDKGESNNPKNIELIEGYIISLRGDTLNGVFYEKLGMYGLDNDYILMPHPSLYHKQIVFLPDQAMTPKEIRDEIRHKGGKRKPREFSPADIRGFKLSNSDFTYISLAPENDMKKAFFARPVETGKISLYSRRMPTPRLPQEFYLKKGYEVIPVKAGDNPEKIAGLFQDAKEVYNKVLNGDFANNSEELIILVRSYNDFMSKEKK